MRKQYTRRQIVEAINYWKHQLNESNEGEITPEAYKEGMSTLHNMELMIDELPEMPSEYSANLQKAINKAMDYLRSTQEN